MADVSAYYTNHEYTVKMNGKKIGKIIDKDNDKGYASA